MRRSIAAAVERAVAAGATKVREVDERDEHWVVLQDPEGNEFCMH
ncbi:MAG TPA: VOC family protein [Actinomycetes bacterium]|nr:VOC family protein [Actinomycetes bacterium]